MNLRKADISVFSMRFWTGKLVVTLLESPHILLTLLLLLLYVSSLCVCDGHLCVDGSLVHE